MDNLELLCKEALKGFFHLLERNEDYLKTRLLVNSSKETPLPDTLTKLHRLERKFEMDYKAFNQKYSQLIEYIKSNTTKSVAFSIKKGLPLEGSYTIELDKDNNLTVRRH